MNSRRKYVLKEKLMHHKDDSFYLCGNVFNLRMTGDISEATNYGILRRLYKLIAEKKFNKEFLFTNALGITMHFDSKLEVETGGMKGFVLKIALKLIRLVERLQAKLKNQ